MKTLPVFLLTLAGVSLFWFSTPITAVAQVTYNGEPYIQSFNTLIDAGTASWVDNVMSSLA